MRRDRTVTCIAYATLAVTLASGCLACDSTSHPTVSTSPAISGIGAPAPTGPGGPPVPVPAPVSVTSIVPRTGAAGSQVTILGTGFDSAVGVCFGSAASPHYQVSDSGARITAVVPFGFGTVPVAVVTATGAPAQSRNDTFTYTYRSSTAAGGRTSSAPPASLCVSVPPETSS